MRKQFKTEIKMSVSLWMIIVGLITFALLMSCNKKPIEVNPNVEMIKGSWNLDSVVYTNQNLPVYNVALKFEEDSIKRYSSSTLQSVVGYSWASDTSIIYEGGGISYVDKLTDHELVLEDGIRLVYLSR